MSAGHPGAAPGIAMLLWRCDPAEPDLLHVPFEHATAAIALDLAVEIYFSGRSVLLLKKGLASALRTSGRAESVYDAMCQSAQHGARLLACSRAMQEHGVTAADLIGECSGQGGAVQFMARAAEPAWRTLVF